MRTRTSTLLVAIFFGSFGKSVGLTGALEFAVELGEIWQESALAA